MENETLSFVENSDQDEAHNTAASGDDTGEAEGKLLRRLDEVFGPLMAYCTVDDRGSHESAPALVTDPRQSMTPERMWAEARASAERFKAMSAMQPPQPDKNGKIPPKKGKDVVYIGFDAEWETKSKGRNHVLSVQFHLVGPNGNVFEKVYDMSQVEYTKDRMRLADAIYDLLDEAEADAALDEWPLV